MVFFELRRGLRVRVLVRVRTCSPEFTYTYTYSNVFILFPEKILSNNFYLRRYSTTTVPSYLITMYTHVHVHIVYNDMKVSDTCSRVRKYFRTFVLSKIIVRAYLRTFVRVRVLYVYCTCRAS